VQNNKIIRFCASDKIPLYLYRKTRANWELDVKAFFLSLLKHEVEVILRPTVSRLVCLGVRRPYRTRDQFFFLLEISFRQLRVCYFVAPSLTRGRVCNLLVQLLLGLAKAVTPGSKSCRTRGYILLSRVRLPQPGGPGSCIYIPQEQGCPVIPPGTGFPFCCVFRLGGLRWRYSTPPPHGLEA
jgi:hypothetical protein